MASRYLFEPEFCNPASGWEKRQVEKNVQDARRRLWRPVPRLACLEVLNDWLEDRCKDLRRQTSHGQMRGTIADVWAEEAQALMPTSRPFDGFVEYTKRVSPTCLVHLDRNRYSVPASFANRPVSLHGMAQAVGELTEQGSPAFEAAIPILSQLLKAETAEREVRSVAYQLKAARFPAYRDLNGFDFSSSEINEALVRQLHRCEFIDEANNIVLVGGPGTGKTHVATAIGVQAIEHHRRRVRFFPTVELVNALEQEKAQDRSGQIANRLVHSDLIILDELGYLPFSTSRKPTFPHVKRRRLSSAELVGRAFNSERDRPPRRPKARCVRDAETGGPWTWWSRSRQHQFRPAEETRQTRQLVRACRCG